ncbi:MAG: hypothetical protein WCE81_09685 [Halobacteriota archaeon]
MTENKIKINLDIPFSFLYPPKGISPNQLPKYRKRQKEHPNEAFPFITYNNHKAQLCFGLFISNGSMVPKRIDETAIGLDNETLITAVESELQGGVIIQGERYDIPDFIKNALSTRIDTVKKLVAEKFSNVK